MLDNRERDLSLNDFKAEKIKTGFKMPQLGLWGRIPLSLSVSALYLLVGSLWVAFSDMLLINIVQDRSLVLQYQTYKGWLFVLVTAVILYHIINISVKQIQKSKEAIREKYMEIAIIHQDLTTSEDKLRRQNEELRKSQEALQTTAEKIHYLAYYDSLTDLPNRDMFTDILNRVLKEKEQQGCITGMMFLDLDNFKTINDTLGHTSGDQLLKSVGLLLKWCIGDNNIIARLGGDEFFILMSDIKSRDEISAKASKIIESLQKPWIMDDHEFYITDSIGIVIFPHDGIDAMTLYRNADTAMYRAKHLGKNTYQFYTEDMNTEILKRIEMESYLRHALNRNEFTLYYQPQVDIKTGKIEGAEALIRWIHPTMGFVSPMDFIPLAEETGLILQIGEWVLYTACKQNKAFQDAGLPPVRIAVNLSVRQLQQSDFIETLELILKETGLEPKWLELEITESLAMKDIAYTITVLTKIRDMGIYVSLDDFGTGYSSLNYLKRLPITTLKIDKSFVHDITVISSEEAIAKALILIAHNMSLMVVAEGVETQDQFAFLKAQNCDRVQGYLFSRPVPVQDFEMLLTKETIHK